MGRQLPTMTARKLSISAIDTRILLLLVLKPENMTALIQESLDNLWRVQAVGQTPRLKHFTMSATNKINRDFHVIVEDTSAVL